MANNGRRISTRGYTVLKLNAPNFRLERTKINPVILFMLSFSWYRRTSLQARARTNVVYSRSIYMTTLFIIHTTPETGAGGHFGSHGSIGRVE